MNKSQTDILEALNREISYWQEFYNENEKILGMLEKEKKKIINLQNQQEEFDIMKMQVNDFLALQEIKSESYSQKYLISKLRSVLNKNNELKNKMEHEIQASSTWNTPEKEKFEELSINDLTSVTSNTIINLYDELHDVEERSFNAMKLLNSSQNHNKDYIQELRETASQYQLLDEYTNDLNANEKIIIEKCNDLSEENDIKISVLKDLSKFLNQKSDSCDFKCSKKKLDILILVTNLLLTPDMTEAKFNYKCKFTTKRILATSTPVKMESSDLLSRLKKINESLNHTPAPKCKRIKSSKMEKPKIFDNYDYPSTRNAV